MSTENGKESNTSQQQVPSGFLTNIKLRTISAAAGLAADSCMTGVRQNRPQEFAEYCLHLIAGMVVDDANQQRWTIDEVRQLPDGVLQEIATMCIEKRAADQDEAKKNFGNLSTAQPISLRKPSEKSTSTACLPESTKLGSSSGANILPDNNHRQPPVTIE